VETIGLLFICWVLGLWGLLIWAASHMANAKGRHSGNWALLTVAYGLVAVIVLALVPPADRA